MTDERAVCAEYIALKQALELYAKACAQETAQLRARAAQLREELKTCFQSESRSNCYLLDDDALWARTRGALPEAIQHGVAEPPPYVRLVTHSSPASIREGLLLEILDELSYDEIARRVDEDGLTALQAVQELVLERVREETERRVERVNLSKSLERGISADMVPKAPASIAERAMQLHAVSERMRMFRVGRERQSAEYTQRLNEVEERLATLMRERHRDSLTINSTSRGRFRVRVDTRTRARPLTMRAFREDLLPSELASEVLEGIWSAD
jgi:hypothetical protein